jgi:hypothetical protein
LEHFSDYSANLDNPSLARLEYLKCGVQDARLGSWIAEAINTTLGQGDLTVSS